MQKKILFAAGSVMLFLAGWGLYQFNRGHEDAGGVPASADLAAQTLFSAYQTDENAANGRYLGKVIRVTGAVADISVSGNSGTVVLGQGEGGGVNCGFGPEAAASLKKIHKGEQVACKCRCTGFLMDVNLSDCVLAP